MLRVGVNEGYGYIFVVLSLLKVVKSFVNGMVWAFLCFLLSSFSLAFVRVRGF